jgi:hypothetical protein
MTRHDAIGRWLEDSETVLTDYDRWNEQRTNKERREIRRYYATVKRNK